MNGFGAPRHTHLLGSPAKRQAYTAIAGAYLRTAHLLVNSGEPWNEDTCARRR